MFRLKPIKVMTVFASCLTATQALSVQVSYFGDSVALVMLDPEAAAFECAYNDLPAQIEINEDTRAEVRISFVSALFGYEEPPQAVVESGTEVVERRGTDSVRVRVQDNSSGVDPEPTSQDADRPTLLPDEWHVTVTGEIDFCVGLATLKIMDGNLDVRVQVGQYEAHILHTEDMPGDLRVLYQTDLSNLDPLPLIVPLESDPARANADKYVGSVAVEGGRNLGDVRFYDRQTDVKYTSPTDPDGVTDNTGLSFRFTLVEAASVSD
ncbi:hypothetical protein [Roseobacter sp. CCS2]|uniref:hypothetical protein n=1 Tax=Roseobacter sp. CCS2 TaxID=391593 RepID=UPI00030C65A6|nr:hypothetical protein [Roseobacter sp. CCS2]